MQADVQQKTTTNTNTSGSTAERALSSKREALRGLTYEQQLAMLRPEPEGAPHEDKGDETDPEALRVATQVCLAASNVPAYHVIVEQLAHRYAYDAPVLSTDAKATQASGLKSIGYRKVDVVASDATGFQATLFMPYVKTRADLDPAEAAKIQLPDGTRLHPVIAFRGTDATQKVDVLDDTNPAGIGTFQWAMHEEDVIALASRGTIGGVRPDVTGHSLGGALAQLAAARIGGFVGDVITFQAPGVNADDVERVRAQGKQSSHYLAPGDVVPLAGQGRTPGTETQIIGTDVSLGLGRHSALPLAELNESRRLAGDANLVPSIHGTQAAARVATTQTGPASSGVIEGIRGGLGGTTLLPSIMQRDQVMSMIDAAMSRGPEAQEALRQSLDSYEAKDPITAQILDQAQKRVARLESQSPR